MLFELHNVIECTKGAVFPRAKGFRWNSIAHAAAISFLATACAPLHQISLPADHDETLVVKGEIPRQSHYVPMRDGVEIALSVYRPSGEGPFPTLLWILPDRRETIDPITGKIEPTMAWSDIEFFTDHGYAIALSEMRGGGASFGSRELDRGPQIGRDGADLVEWIAGQRWSDGTLGMVGASYQGFAQYATAAEAPDGLKAIFPEIAGFDDYGSMFYPGGILNIGLSQYAAPSMALAAQNTFDPSKRQLPSAPVVDEDQDGELIDEIPLDLDGDGSFLDEEIVRYSDGNTRKDIYLRATQEHSANLQLTVDSLASSPFRDSKLGGTDYSYLKIGPAARPQTIADAQIAVYNRGGWFDYHARDTALWFATLSGRTPTRLMMAPTGHGGLPRQNAEEIYRAGPYFDHFSDNSTNSMLNDEKLRFFDRYVRGIENGFEQEAPVLIYVMGEGWRREKEWPLARALESTLHLAAGGMLEWHAGEQAQDIYNVDPLASSISNGANRWNYGISRASDPMVLEGSENARLSYSTPVLASDLEVTGHPVLELLLSSTSDNGDVYAYLEDVAPDGSSLLVSEGQLRANYHRQVEINNMLAAESSEFGVGLDLPWQGFTSGDYQPAPFANNAQLRLRFDLMPTSWVFKKGHRLRLSISGADWPTFARHPELNDNEVQKWTIWRGAGLSTLTLPVIPKAEE